LWFAGLLLTAIGADEFTVDSSQSRITISGSFHDTTLKAQGPGSLTTHYGGTLLAELSGDTIRFPGQSQVMALDSGSWEPRADGSDGSAPANYGGEASVFLSTGVAAVRQVTVDITSEVLPIANGQFDTRGLTLSIPDGAPSSLAYRVEGALQSSGAAPLGGHSATGQVATGTITTVNGQQVLTIPINYQFNFSIVDDNDTTVTLTGQLVATRSLAALPTILPTAIPTQVVTAQRQDSPNQQ
jgi:hypothetical protein